MAFGPLFPSASYCLVSKDWGGGRGDYIYAEHILSFKTHTPPYIQAQRLITSVITVPAMTQASLIHYMWAQNHILRRKYQNEKERLAFTVILGGDFSNVYAGIYLKTQITQLKEHQNNTVVAMQIWRNIFKSRKLSQDPK